MICFDMKNAVVSSTLYVALRRLIFLSLSTLSLMCRIKSIETPSCKTPVSLLDCDHLGNNNRPKLHFDQLKDLISFGEAAGAEENIEQKDAENERIVGSAVRNSKLDTLVEANMKGFASQANETLLVEPLECNSGLVRRR